MVLLAGLLLDPLELVEGALARLVEKPALAAEPVLPLKARVSGDTRKGTSHVGAYRYPAAPFGNAPDTPPMVEAGGEILYWTELDAPAANIGVSLVQVSPGAQIDPFFLGAKDENTVQGFAGTPIDVNELTYDYLDQISAAGASFPKVQRFFVAVDGLRQLSGLRWGDGEPELALVHGGAQNAHTFDTVALALQRPLVALDLPARKLPATGDLRRSTPARGSRCRSATRRSAASGT